MIELPEPSAHMYPSDLERFQETETFAHAYSVKVGCPDETSTELYTADQLRTCIKKAAAEAREQMREECERLRADAERYRLIRQHPTFMGWDSDFRPDEIDAEVDKFKSLAARAKP